MPPDDAALKLDRFLKEAKAQIGDTYRFGAKASADDPDPSVFDSSELVEWAAHRAGVTEMPDGSWNQFRHLQQNEVTVHEALKTPGALVFGFSSDPLASPDRPSQAYVGISLGDGTVLDVSERSGQVRIMDPGDYYTRGATIPELHGPGTIDPRRLPGGVGPMPQPDPDPAAGPQQSHGPDGRILHQDLPGDWFPNWVPQGSEGPVCYPEPGPDWLPPTADGPVSRPDEPAPDGPVCEPDDGVADPTGPTSSLDPTWEAQPVVTSYADQDALYAASGLPSGPSDADDDAGDSTYSDASDAYDLSMDA